MFFSIFKKSFVKFLPYKFINVCGLEDTGLFVLNIPVELEENLQVPDFENVIILKSGIEPAIVEPNEYKSSHITRKQMIAESKDANKYLKREKRWIFICHFT